MQIDDEKKGEKQQPPSVLEQGLELGSNDDFWAELRRDHHEEIAAQKRKEQEQQEAQEQHNNNKLGASHPQETLSAKPVADQSPMNAAATVTRQEARQRAHQEEGGQTRRPRDAVRNQERLGATPHPSAPVERRQRQGNMKEKEDFSIDTNTGSHVFHYFLYAIFYIFHIAVSGFLIGVIYPTISILICIFSLRKISEILLTRRKLSRIEASSTFAYTIVFFLIIYGFVASIFQQSYLPAATLNTVYLPQTMVIMFISTACALRISSSYDLKAIWPVALSFAVFASLFARLSVALIAKVFL